jgi:integrase/recombinase XerD
VIERWLQWLNVERGLLASTVSGYQRELRQLEQAKGSLEDLSTDDLRDHLLSAGGSASTVAGRIAAFRSFYGFLVRCSYRTDDPTARLDRPKVRRGLPKPLQNRSEAFARLEPEYQLIATVLCETGLRISEGVALQVSVPAPEQVVVCGKGSKERIVLLTDAARSALDSLGGSLKYQVRTIQRRFKQAGFTPHQCRHTLACDLAASGADLGEIQEILGHSSPATTRVYAAYGTDRLRAALDRRKALAYPSALVQTKPEGGSR